MNLISGPLRQPGAHLRMFVSGVIVHDQVNIQVSRDGVVQPTQECEELLMPVAGFALGENGPGGDVQGGKQSGRPVANVIVDDSLDVTEAHGQHRLRPVQSLNLALFIDAQHQSMIGRIQIQTRDIAHFFDEERIVGKFETASAMGLQREGAEQAMHSGLGDATSRGRSAHGPVSSGLWPAG